MFPLGSQPLDHDALRQHLDATLTPLLAATPARVSLSLRDLDGGVVLAHHAERAQPAASIIKVPILLTLLAAVAEGRYTLEQPLALPARADRAGGTGILAQLPGVTALSLAELARLMIVLSDNVATNALIDLLGFDAVNQWNPAAGLTASRLQRRMMDAAAREAGRDNFTSAGDATAALCWLLRDGALPAPLRAFALDVLADQRERAHFGAALPAAAHLASKAGQLPGLRHDAGILTVDYCSVVLAVLADGFTDWQTAHTLHGGAGAALLGQIARAVALGLKAQAQAH